METANKVAPKQLYNKRKGKESVRVGNHWLNKHWMCHPLHPKCQGPAKIRPHAVTGEGQQNPAAGGLIHRMLDVPRGCALSPGGSGRASETAQVRGLGYPVSRRPAAGTPAPPAPDTPQSEAWQARHSLDSGHACSRQASCTLDEEIWRGPSMAICRSGAYLR
jgi:hypothetical protein